MEDILAIAQTERQFLIKHLDPMIDEFILTKLKIAQLKQHGKDVGMLGLALDSILTNIDVVFKQYASNILNINHES